MSNATIQQTPKPEMPQWLAEWKNEAETVAIFKLIRPKFHRTTLHRMRKHNRIEATKFAGRWYYKPETAMPKGDV